MNYFFPLSPSLTKGLFYIKIYSVLSYFLSVGLDQKCLGAKGNLCIYASLI